MSKFKFDKRKIIVLCLVFVLISISYLNYMLNNKSLLETSSDLEKYEEKQMAEMKNNDTFKDSITHEGPSDDKTATSSIMTIEDDNNIVDSTESDLNDIIAVSNMNIETSLENNEMSNFNYFLQAKIDIEIEREKTIERFDEIINNEKIDEGLRNTAVSKKIKIIDNIKKEKMIESLIKSKGFEESVVFITDENVYVTVQSEELLQADMAKILDIVSRETKYPLDNITIQNK